MAIIYSYPIVTPTTDDLLLGTDQGAEGKPTKNFTISSIVDLISAGATGLGAVIEINPSAKNALGVNQSASDFANISGTGGVTFGSFTDGTMTIINGTGAGFTAITSTDFIGNITGIVKAGSSIAGTAGGTDAQNVLGVTQNAGDNSLRLATTAYVDGKVDPSILTFLGTNGGDQTVTLATQKFSILGTANQIETDGTAQKLTIKFPTAGVTLPDGSVATTQAATDDSTKVATTAFVRDYDDLQDLDFSGTTGTGAVVLNSQTLAIAGTANQVVTSAAGQTLTIALTNPVVRNLTGDVTGILKATSSIESTVTGVTQTQGNDSTRLATTEYVDAAAGAKVLQYQGDTGGPFNLNLKDDDLDIAGGSNISTTAATVTAGNLGIITIDLDDSIALTGQVKADNFRTTAGTATWVTTVLAGFTSITSTTFIADNTASVTNFQGNASSATKLGSSDGSIQLSAGSGATLGVGSNSVVYTNGGDIQLVTTLQSSTVTGKVLTGLPTPAAATVVATDTILQGFGKLQSQINGIADGLQFQGTWNANIDEGGAGATPNGTPALTSGGGEASSGTTDATTADELVDSTKNFTTAPNVVVVGDKVINQVDGQEALVNDITNAASGRLGLAADIMLTGEAYIIDKTPFITAGHYYVVNTVGATTAKNATLNGIQDWQIGDWVIASTTNVWQKLNNSAVEGSGTENRLPKWTAAVSTLVDSDIIDDGNTIKLESDIELGSAAGDEIKSVGVLTTDQQLILKKGLGVGATPSYGATGQALFTSAASANPPVWTDVKWVISDASNTSDVSNGETVTFAVGSGLTVGESSKTLTYGIDYAGANNAIIEATAYAKASDPIITTEDEIWFNDKNTNATPPVETNVIKKAKFSDLPFNNFSWIIEANSGTGSPYTVVSGDTIDFVGVGNVSTAWDNSSKELRISASSDPGTGTQFTLPVWDTTTSLGDSMVSQDAATGTTLTVTGVTPTLVINDTTTGKGDLKISRSLDATTYMSAGITTPATDITYGTHVFSQTDGTTPRPVLTLNADRTSTFSNNIVIDQGDGTGGAAAAISRIHTGTADGTDNGGITISSAGGTSSGRGAWINLNGNENSGDAYIRTGNAANAELYLIAEGASGSAIKMQTAGSDTLTLAHDKSATFAGSASISTTLTTGGSITVATHGLLSITGGNNLTISGTATNHAGLIFATNAILPATVSAENNGVVDLGANGNQFKDLYLSGNVIHGGSGTGTKGGTFNKLFTSVAAGSIAFTIDRATSGAMVFDVMMTSDTSNACSIAKKFTVVKQFGVNPVVYKILDTGPDLTVDFTPVFEQHTANTSIKCTITPNNLDTQKIGITIDLGFGNHDATVVMNA